MVDGAPPACTGALPSGNGPESKSYTSGGEVVPTVTCTVESAGSGGKVPCGELTNIPPIPVSMRTVAGAVTVLPPDGVIEIDPGAVSKSPGVTGSGVRSTVSNPATTPGVSPVVTPEADRT